MCHQNKYPIDVIQRGMVCSDPDYSDQASCEAATPVWRRSVGDCSDPQYVTIESCEAGTLTWDPVVYNSDPVINDAIASGVAGNPVYCSDCHYENVERHDIGECSDSSIYNEVECILECSNSAYTTQVECLANSATWDVPTGKTWNSYGYCNDIRFDNQTACESGGEPVWYAATLACSDPQYSDQTSCETAVSTPIWNDIIPYSVHDKYNGHGIYSFSETHHDAEIWDGTCSNSGITDEDACYVDGSTWTPTYTPNETYVGNGDCTACHMDPRLDPYKTGESLPVPKLMACRVCHVDIDSSAGQMTVYKDRVGSQNGGSTWTWNFDGDIANTVPADLSGVPHQWDIDSGEINSYGVCLFCHKMRPYHAFPGRGVDNDPNTIDDTYINYQANSTVDAPYFPATGRATFGAFFGENRYPYKWYKDINPGDQKGEKNTYKVIVVNDSAPMAGITYAKVVYDPQSDPQGMVPVDSVCADSSYSTQSTCESSGNWWRPGHQMLTPVTFYVPTFDPPAGGDAVTINTSTSVYDRSAKTITIKATNSNGTSSGTALYAIYNGKQKAMSYSGGIWTATFTAADGVQDAGHDSNGKEVGRVYVISVNDSSDLKDVLDQDYIDLPTL